MTLKMKTICDGCNEEVSEIYEKTDLCLDCKIKLKGLSYYIFDRKATWFFIGVGTIFILEALALIIWVFTL